MPVMKPVKDFKLVDFAAAGDYWVPSTDNFRKMLLADVTNEGAVMRFVLTTALATAWAYTDMLLLRADKEPDREGVVRVGLTYFNDWVNVYEIQEEGHRCYVVCRSAVLRYEFVRYG